MTDHQPIDHTQKFRLRGQQTTRIETLTDAAFAFAFTLLVIGQGKLPANYAELVLALQHIPAFVASFALLGTFWYGHHQWSRRTGLDDGFTVFLSFVLVLTILVYVYPLKAVFSSMFHWFSGGVLPAGIQLQSINELSGLFMVYGVGFALMCLCLIFLQWHALRSTFELPLNLLEQTILRTEMQAWALLGTVGLISTLVAALAPGKWVVLAGFVYGSLSVLMPLFGHFARAKHRRVAALLAAPDAP
jgi:uncharacterized membrane protein